MVFITLTLFCYHHHYPFPELFIIPNKNCTIKQQSMYITLTPHPQLSLGSPHILPVSMTLSRVGASQKWTHAMLVLCF